jgi:hypothetical protein
MVSFVVVGELLMRVSDHRGKVLSFFFSFLAMCILYIIMHLVDVEAVYICYLHDINIYPFIKIASFVDCSLGFEKFLGQPWESSTKSLFQFSVRLSCKPKKKTILCSLSLYFSSLICWSS